VTISYIESSSDPKAPVASLLVRAKGEEVYYDAKFRHDGKQVMRRIGPAWLSRDSSGNWVARKGRIAPGYFDERRAHVRAAAIAESYVRDLVEVERVERERLTRGVTFREVAHAYLDWLKDVREAKPSTLSSHRSDLAERGTPHKRGGGAKAGYIMAGLGDTAAAKVTTAQVDAVLSAYAATGVGPRSVNRYREIIVAIFSFGVQSSRFNLPSNPALRSDRRRPPAPGALIFYTPEEVEALARTLAEGRHRDMRPYHDDRLPHMVVEDEQDAEAVRIAAYCGLRLGELLALRWRNVDWRGSALTVERAISAGIEGTPKSGQVRRVPMADQAAAALDRLSRRDHFTAPDDLVFGSEIGRPRDGSALRRRYKKARDVAGLRPLRWHDLRHTFGSLLVAGGVDLVTVQDAMGHAQLTTTSRYLHARPATESASRFTSAFAITDPSDARLNRLPTKASRRDPQRA
jgi:integrase